MKIKSYKVVSLVIIVVFSLFLSACDQKEYVNQLEKIKAEGKIVLGTSADYPPYEFHKIIDGKDTIIGFDIEIAKEIAKDLGVELVIKDMSFKGLLAAVDSGNVDFVIAGMTPTPDREKNVDFSKIYYTAVQAIVVRKEDMNTYTSLADLAGKSVGVLQGSIQQELAEEQLTSSQIKALGRVPDLMLELKNDKVDALIVELPVASAYVDKNSDLALTNIEIGATEEGSAVAVKNGSSELIAAINATLDRLIEAGLIDQFVAEANDLVE
jgi:arginine/lysine/histidine transporter system substrate-binding protein